MGFVEISQEENRKKDKKEQEKGGKDKKDKKKEKKLLQEMSKQTERKKNIPLVKVGAHICIVCNDTCYPLLTLVIHP